MAQAPYPYPLVFDYTITEPASMPWVVLNPREMEAPDTIVVEVDLGDGAALLYDVHCALTNVNQEPEDRIFYVQHPTLTNESTSKASTLNNPFMAVRVDVKAFTLGSTPTNIRFTIIEPNAS